MPTAVAIENGRDVLLANKETLVIGGEIINKMAQEKKLKLYRLIVSIVQFIN